MMNQQERSPAALATPMSGEGVNQAAAVAMEAIPLAMRAIRREMRAGRDPALSIPQFRALLFLRREPNAGLGTTAEYLGITAGAASELIERLVRQGLVDREADPHERRRVQLRLTDRGADQLRAAEERTRRWLVGVLGCLDPAQLARLEVALADLRQAVMGATGDHPAASGTNTG